MGILKMESLLWKAVFEAFSFEKANEDSGSYKIAYSGEHNFISNLKTLAPLLVIEGKSYGAYQIDSFKKGMSLELVKNLDYKKNASRLP